MYKNIEFVCTGNNGRSPIAEIVAQRVIYNQGLADVVTIISSGTAVALPEDPMVLKGMLKPLVDKAIDRGILEPDRIEILESQPNLVLDELVANEERMRVAYLSNSLGYAPLDFKRKQTVVRPEADLILPMDNGNKEKVEAKYAGSGYNPRIVTLGDFSGIRGMSLEQDFPETDNDYIKTAAKVQSTTEVAILRALDIII